MGGSIFILKYFIKDWFIWFVVYEHFAFLYVYVHCCLQKKKNLMRVVDPFILHSRMVLNIHVASESPAWSLNCS